MSWPPMPQKGEINQAKAGVSLSTLWVEKVFGTFLHVYLAGFFEMASWNCMMLKRAKHELGLRSSLKYLRNEGAFDLRFTST